MSASFSLQGIGSAPGSGTFFFKQLLQMILAENDISQFRPDLVWKTQFVFMGVVTGNPFVSCPQLRAISASSTVYKVINQAMICTHKRNCTPEDCLSFADKKTFDNCRS